MMFYSTNDKSHRVDARAAVLAGLAPDGGLYMPETIPQLPAAFFDELADASLHEIGLTVARVFFGDVVPDAALKSIVADALNFEIPLVTLHVPRSTFHAPRSTLHAPRSTLHAPRSTLHVLELFHGPTLAFKDVGARFMARLMGYFVGGSDRELTILVATSGDTGSAVASGFAGVPGIRVVILYPSGKVSEIQEAQLTTMGGNVTALKIDGVFDDCQRLVKQAFVDEELTSRLKLTSANSINIARLIPQTFYYFWAIAQLSWTSPLFKGGLRGVTVSVPSGNFGNLTAGLIAKRMGLPVEQFIAATNVNDVVPEYLETAVFRPRPSTPTISNAMDVGHPSNFARMLELYTDVESMRRDIVGIRVSEEETRATIARVFHETAYILDPHAAVAYAALSSSPPCPRGGKGGRERVGGCCDLFFLATAHPAKFKDVVEEETGSPVVVPLRLANCLLKQKTNIKMPADFEAFKLFLLGRFGA